MDVRKDLLSPEDAAKYLGISLSQLAIARRGGFGPTALRIGKRLVRYLTSDLDVWLEARRNNAPETLPPPAKKLGRPKKKLVEVKANKSGESVVTISAPPELRGKIRIVYE